MLPRSKTRKEIGAKACPSSLCHDVCRRTSESRDPQTGGVGRWLGSGRPGIDQNRIWPVSRREVWRRNGGKNSNSYTLLVRKMYVSTVIAPFWPNNRSRRPLFCAVYLPSPDVGNVGIERKACLLRHRRQWGRPHARSSLPRLPIGADDLRALVCDLKVVRLSGLYSGLGPSGWSGLAISL
jgi:hypothetical protein